MIVCWWVDELEDHKDIAALILYGGALLGAWATRLVPARDPAPPAAPAPARGAA
ncbi:hypothetical protein D3C83_248130 [compost metagenome]